MALLHCVNSHTKSKVTIATYVKIPFYDHKIFAARLVYYFTRNKRTKFLSEKLETYLPNVL